MATQVLVVKPPYSYCRNPMKLGTTLFYFGIGCAWLYLVNAVLLRTHEIDSPFSPRPCWSLWPRSPRY